MSDELESFAHQLGVNTGVFMAADEYYVGVGPDELDDVLDDAWMMGATQDSLVDAGFPIHADPDVRRIAHAAFTAGFKAAFAG